MIDIYQNQTWRLDVNCETTHLIKVHRLLEKHFGEMPEHQGRIAQYCRNAGAIIGAVTQQKMKPTRGPHDSFTEISLDGLIHVVACVVA